jgi:hypothetical protein
MLLERVLAADLHASKIPASAASVDAHAGGAAAARTGPGS